MCFCSTYDIRQRTTSTNVTATWAYLQILAVQLNAWNVSINFAPFVNSACVVSVPLLSLFWCLYWFCCSLLPLNWSTSNFNYASFPFHWILVIFEYVCPKICPDEYEIVIAFWNCRNYNEACNGFTTNWCIVIFSHILKFITIWCRANFPLYF